MSSETSTYKSGAEIAIADLTVTLGARKNASGTSIRWSWHCSSIDLGSEGTYATPELAVANAEKILGGGECRHGVPTAQFCSRCHDYEI